MSHKVLGGCPFSERFDDIVEHQHNRGRLELQPGLRLQPIVGFEVILARDEGMLVTDE